ncbi:MAG: hypothetical protein K2F72_08140, partial [Muribaculaceae bacterium]|nr:hypothetical protein [Muribaculaceae bacterium]
MIKRLIMALAVVAGALCACAQEPSLEEMVAVVAKECPVNLDKGNSLDAVRLLDDAVEIHLVMALPAAQFPMLEQSVGMLRPTMLKMLLADGDMQKVASKTAGSGRGMLFPVATVPLKSSTGISDT